MNKLKLSWNGSTWTHSGEVDTGIVDAHFMKTITNLLKSLKTDGFTATQVVIENTSIVSVACEYNPNKTNVDQAKELAKYVTSQTSGLSSNQSNEISREFLLNSCVSWDGENGQITTSGYQLGHSYLTSTQTETRSDTTRLDTLQEEIDALRSRVDALQSAMDSRLSQNAENIWRSQRGAETQLSSGCVESQPSVSQAQVLEQYFGEWRSSLDRTNSSWYA